MSFMDRLHRAISDDERQAGRRQCFIGHAFRDRDVRVTLERALQTLDLSAYFADREITSEPIINKVYHKIRVTRASIVDLTFANPNVYFELGVAIGLNKPVFVISRDIAVIPPLLEGFVKLRFSSYAELEHKLTVWLSDGLKDPPGSDLPFSPHCNFVNVLCSHRQRLDPQQRYVVIDQRADGANPLTLTGDPDLATGLGAALNPSQYTPIFLEDVLLSNTLRFCDYCRDLRDSAFAVCHFTRQSSNTVYALFGLITGLRIPALLLIQREPIYQGQFGWPVHFYQGQFGWPVPSLLQGLDMFSYESYAEISERLGTAISSFLKECKQRQFKLRKQTAPSVNPWGTALQDVAFRTFQVIPEHDILSRSLVQPTPIAQVNTPLDPSLSIDITEAAVDTVVPIESETNLSTATNDPNQEVEQSAGTGWHTELRKLVIRFSDELLESLRPSSSLAGQFRGPPSLFEYRQVEESLAVQIEVVAEDAMNQTGRVLIDVYLHDGDPFDQQGSQVMLRAEEQIWQSETNEVGSVVFTSIPLALLPKLQIEIVPAGVR